jgi:hypothetical protein
MRAGIYRRHKTNRGAHMEETEALKQTVVDPLEEIDRITERVIERLADEDVPLSIADLIRLLELRRELAKSQPGRIRVRWIDECQPTPEE